MKMSTRATGVLILFILGMAAYSQDIHYNYDRGTNFASYKTYQWVDIEDRAKADQLMDQNIKRAIDEQLAQKGLTKVEKDGDLYIGYQTAVKEEKNVNLYGTGPRWYGGMVQGQTSTITTGMLVVSVFDPSRKQLIWRGDASKTLDPKKDPDKNYKNLQKAMAKLFKNYPPPVKK